MSANPIIPRVWITKYALTKGIFELADVEQAVEISDGMIVETTGSYRNRYHGEGREWHRTCESAVTKVMEMIAAKRKSVAAALAKLDKLEEKLKGEK